MVGKKDLQQQRRENEPYCHEMPIDASDQFRDISHCGDVGGNIQYIRKQQEQYDPLEHKRRESFFDVGRQALPSNPADTGAHGLDGGHQRKAKGHSSRAY